MRSTRSSTTAGRAAKPGKPTRATSGAAKKAAKGAAPTGVKPEKPSPRSRTAGKALPAPASSVTQDAGHPARDAGALAPFADLLLPYQIRYLRDRSPMKKLVKSRRIGGTWMQSLEDVLDCIDKPGLKVWFSSADRTAGAEYLDYVKLWVEIANLMVQTVVVLEAELGTGDDIPEVVDVADPTETTATVVLFHNGSKITMLSSNPSAFRSKGGKVVLDEFAHHKSDRELWKAAQPVAGAWGYDIRVLSTQNGKGCAFYRLGNPEFQRLDDDADPDGTSEGDAWSVHTITIVDAVADGMYDRVRKRPTTADERAAYIRRLRKQCISDAQFEEEFMCRASDEAHALLTYDMIASAERAGLLGLDQVKGPLYLGMDVARRKDLSVIYVDELVGGVLVTRVRLEMVRTPFSRQREVLWELLAHPRLVRASIDATGIGAQLAEEAQERFGSYRVEAVTFTSAIKDALATRLLQEFQDGTIRIDPDRGQREGLHAVEKTVSVTNTVRYDAKRDDENGHGDHFWALALCVAAARSGGDNRASVTLSNPVDPRAPGHLAGWDPMPRGRLNAWARLR